jgi:hypothetical protein
MGNPGRGGTATASPAEAASPMAMAAKASPMAPPHPISYSPQLRNLSCSMESSWIGSPPTWPQATSSVGAEVQSGGRNLLGVGPPETEACCPLLDWGCVPTLTSGQIKQLRDVASRGVLWAAPADGKRHAILELHYLGDVEADGNCLFTAIARSLQAHGIRGLSSLDVRLVAVNRFLSDYQSGALDQKQTDLMIRNLYSPNLDSGWGVHVLQEVKLLAKRSERAAMDVAIQELVFTGMTREAAAGSIFKERCVAIEDGLSWAAYMKCVGGAKDEFDIVTLVYTEEGLLSVEENREGKAAAFGDDIALESLAMEWRREIFVVSILR